MTNFIAALPMYDFAEIRDETDAQWAALRDTLRADGVDAPDGLTRKNADMPALPGGIRDTAGMVIAPDPATLPPDGLDVHALWRHPALLLGQTCWGPMELGLGAQVRVVGQPDYSAYEGGDGAFYSSAIVMRKDEGMPVAAPNSGEAVLPLDHMRGRRFGYNGRDSMSGIIALTRDVGAAGETLDIFAERLETGSHRASVVAVADGQADVCTVDCRSWDLIRRFEPRAGNVHIAGWTTRRKGLPYIASAHLTDALIGYVTRAAIKAGLALAVS